MTFSSKDGNPLILITTGNHKGELVGITDKDGNLQREFKLAKGTLIPILNPKARSVEYIAGPSGSGKSTMVANLAGRYLKTNDAKAYLFSRSSQEDDPAFDNIPFIQIPIDKNLINTPVDVTKLEPNTLLVFDDVGTIHDEQVRRAVEKIMMDVLEVGRKYMVHIIITSHLIIPNDKKFARVMMNEIQYMTIFPKCGNSQQISYALKEYFGLGKKEIEKILKLDSRWVRIHNRYPKYVIFDHGAYFL